MKLSRISKKYAYLPKDRVKHLDHMQCRISTNRDKYSSVPRIFDISNFADYIWGRVFMRIGP